MTQPPLQPAGSTRTPWWYWAIVIVCLISIPTCSRHSLVGRPPFTDDGWYASVAWFAYNGWDPALQSPIGVYPRLLSWVFAATDNPFLWLRTIDGCFALLATFAALAFFAAWGREKQYALVCCGAWAIVMNSPPFVDAGFKHQFMPANMFLLSGLALAAARLPQLKNSTLRAALCGLLLGLACLMRESIATSALVGVLAVGALHGLRAGAIACVTTGCTGLLGLYAIAASIHGPSPGGLLTLLRDWSDTAAALTRLGEVMNRPWWTVFVDSGWVTLTRSYFLWAVALVLIVPLVTLIRALNEKLRKRRKVLTDNNSVTPPELARVEGPRPAAMVVLGVCLFAAACVEIFAKLPFPYHFAQLMSPLLVLAYPLYLWHDEVYRKHQQWRGKAAWTLQPTMLLGLCYIFAMIFRPYTFATYSAPYADSDRWTPLMVHGTRDQSLISDSFYLRLADAVQRATPVNGTIVSSGLYYTVYPLARAKPFLPQAADLSLLECFPAARRDEIITQLHAAIAQHGLPHIVIESKRIATDFSRALPGFPERYTLFEELVPGTYYSYGPYDAKVWVLREPVP
jgi:hypothetical protein